MVILGLASVAVGAQTTGTTTFSRAGSLLDASTGSKSYALFQGAFKEGDQIRCEYYGLVRLRLSIIDSEGRLQKGINGNDITASFTGAFNPNLLVALRTKNVFTLKVTRAFTSAILVLQNPQASTGSCTYTIFYPTPLLYQDPPLPAVSYGNAILREPVYAKDPLTGKVIAYFHVGNLGSLPLDEVVVNVKVGSSTTYLYTLPKSVGGIPAHGMSDWVTLALPAGSTLATYFLDSTALQLMNLQQKRASYVVITTMPKIQ
jgi:hypothetical protein